MAFVALLLSAGSCAPSLAVKLPAPAPATDRHLIRVTSSRCVMDRCRQQVEVGREALRVESRSRMASAEESRSLVEIVGKEMVDDLIVLLGGMATRRDLGVATRTVGLEADASLGLRCALSWVQEEGRLRRQGEEVTDRWFIVERMQCDAVRSTDSTVSWRFRAGPTPRTDSLARAADPASREQPTLSAPDLQLHLDRVDGGMVTPYRFTLDSTHGGGTGVPGSIWSVLHPEEVRPPLSVWGVLRPDGTRIATLFWRFRLAPGALDLHPSATPDERQILRLAAAALAPKPDETPPRLPPMK